MQQTESTITIEAIAELPEIERYTFALIMAQQSGHIVSRELTEAIAKWRRVINKKQH